MPQGKAGVGLEWKGTNCDVQTMKVQRGVELINGNAYLNCATMIGKVSKRVAGYGTHIYSIQKLNKFSPGLSQASRSVIAAGSIRELFRIDVITLINTLFRAIIRFTKEPRPTVPSKFATSSPVTQFQESIKNFTRG